MEAPQGAPRPAFQLAQPGGFGHNPTMRMCFLLCLCLFGCDAPEQPAKSSIIIIVPAAPPSQPAEPEAGPGPAPPMEPEPRVRPVPPPFEYPAAPRLIAIGDVHGDLQSAVNALRLVGAINDDRHWVGGEMVVVQVGDQLDRGDDEQAILEWFEQLSDEAYEAGGAFLPLLGNHETMNVRLDFRYVTEGGFADFADVPGVLPPALAAQFTDEQYGRVNAFRPGGPFARLLAGHNLFQKVGDTLFVHGGVLPSHVQYGLDRLNLDVQRWMQGDGPLPQIIRGDESPVWTRFFSDEDITGQTCTVLQQVLRRENAQRMVVAHTVQDDGVNQACDGQVWRIDVGLAAYYGGPLEALEIVGDMVRVLR
jgi:hypothetical protein